MKSGYETEKPEVSVPLSVAKDLDIYPDLPADYKVVEYRSVGGKPFKVFLLQDFVEVRVEDKVALADLIIVEEEGEVLFNDKLIDALNIVIESAGKGLWRFREEERIRESVA